MKIYKWILAGLCSLVAGAGFAQVVEGGKLMFMSAFQPFDMLDLSQHNYAYGTARSAAMAGAFGSLGGDLASMGINPAGLGMYRSSEFGVSFGLGFNTLEQTYSAGPLLERSNTQTRFAPNNLSVVMNTYQGSGALTSFSLGFGYNKVADFNSRSTITLPRNTTSIADMFVRQLNTFQGGLRQGDIKSSGDPFNNLGIDPKYWGAILGFQTELIDPVNKDDNDNTEYVINSMVPGTTEIDPVLRSTRKGSIGEYSFAGGMNFNNRIYVGFSVGIQDIYLLQREEYSEWYRNDPSSADYDSYANNMYYAQELRMNGTGVNLKFGVIARPIDALRIGVAVHTPTWVSIDRDYQATMYTEFNNRTWAERWTNTLAYDYNFRTPTRLMGGVSYTFGPWGVLSVDYERAWYNGIRVSDKRNRREADALNDDVKNIFQATNNVRIGAEFKPLPELAVRAGFAHYQSPLQDNDKLFEAIAAQRTNNFSLGVGYRFKQASIDLAYTYMNTKMSMYDLFYYEDIDNDILIEQEGCLTPKLHRHLVTLSFGVRF